MITPDQWTEWDAERLREFRKSIRDFLHLGEGVEAATERVKRIVLEAAAELDPGAQESFVPRFESLIRLASRLEAAREARLDKRYPRRLEPPPTTNEERLKACRELLERLES
jgi:hypothetical protein